jgi:hypothetical protein
MDGGLPSCCFSFRSIVFSVLASWEITLKGRESRRTRTQRRGEVLRNRMVNSDILKGFRWFFRLGLFCREEKGEA